MKFPIEIERLINEYAKPMTRPNWRAGSYTVSCNNHIKYIGNEYLANVLLIEMTIAQNFLEHDLLLKNLN